MRSVDASRVPCCDRIVVTNQDELVDELLERSCIYSGDLLDVPAKWRRAERLRARHPEIATATIHTAAVCGELDHVVRLLREDPGLVSAIGGPQGWPPLLFVCYARLPHAPAAENSVAIARALLDAGADASASFVSRDPWRLRFTALTGVMGGGEMNQPEHPCARDLARLLLDRGVSPNDSQGLYNTHLVGDDTDWLELLFEYGLDEGDAIAWHAEPGDDPGSILDYLLAQAAARGHAKRVRCLLERGADPNARSVYDGRSCYQAALVAGRLDIADLLLRHGADRERLEGRDAFASACNIGDRAQALALVRAHPEYLATTDVLVDAARGGRHGVVRLLLDLGMDPDVPDKHGLLALHAACEDARMSRLLADFGADPCARCFGASATAWALLAGNTEMARQHAVRSRDIVDAVMAGASDLVSELVTEDASRVCTRTRTGDTLLHLLPDDADAARRIVEILLARGADPTAKNAAGLTPAQKLDADGVEPPASLRPEAP
jgi:ankyrin repeat protein